MPLRHNTNSNLISTISKFLKLFYAHIFVIYTRTLNLTFQTKHNFPTSTYHHCKQTTA